MHKPALRPIALQPRHNALSLAVALAFVAGTGTSIGLLSASALAQSLPTGGQVAAGAATISTPTANSMVVRQTTDRLAINWQSFNIGAGNSVRFDQPSTSSIALNRVLGNSRSEIFGNLSSNGQVFLINPNGVLFGAGAQVDVGGLVASTLNLTDRNFLDGKFVFGDPDNAAASTGSVVNQGSLNAKNGGYLALIGNQVRNTGSMQAHLGSVVLGAGGTAQLTLNDTKLVKFEVTQGALNALAENGGLIRANGGQVILTAGAKESLLQSTVNNTGIIEAQTVDRVAGNILLLAGMAAGTTNVGGTLDASAPASLNPHGGDGGFIETSAAKVKVANTAHVDTSAASGKTGTWLIDPTDFTIAAGGDIDGATLGTQLASNNITLATSAAGAGNGDMLVNDNVAWATTNTLTLNAHRNVDFSGGGTLNGGTGANAGNVTLNAGQGGTSGAIIGHATNTAVTGNTLIANAITGIGSAATPLLTQVNQAALTNTRSGGIYATNTGDVTVAAASTNGDVVIRTADGTNGGFGQAGGAGGNITVGTVNGLVGLTATDPANTGVGNIALTAGNGGTGGLGSLGNGSGGDGGSINLGATLSAGQNATLTAGSGGYGNAGSNGGSGGSINLGAVLSVGQNATLTAGDGVSGVGGNGGSGGSIALSAALSAGQNATLTAGNGGVGNFANNHYGDGGAGGSINLGATLSAAQNATLTAGNGGDGGFVGGAGFGGGGGSISLGAALSAGQNATLTAGNGGYGGLYRPTRVGGDGGSISLGAALSAGQNAILTAGNGGTGYNGGGGNGGSVNLGAALSAGHDAALAAGNAGRIGSGFGDAGSAGTITGASVDVSAAANLNISGNIAATSGDVSLRAGMNAGNTLTASVSDINAGAGNITLQGYNLNVPGTLNLTGNTVSIKTANGIGSSAAPILSTANKLALVNTVSGGIYATNTGDVTVAAASTNGDVVIRTANGAVNFAGNGGAGGTITVGTVNGLVGITSTDPGNSGVGNVAVTAGDGGGGGATIASFGSGGSVNLSAPLTAARNATVTAGTGGLGGAVNLGAALTAGQDAAVTAGTSFFGSGGSILVGNALTAGQNASLAAGMSVDISANANVRASANDGGSIVVNGALNAGSNATLTAGQGGSGHSSNGGNGGAIVLNGVLNAGADAVVKAGNAGNGFGFSAAGGAGGSIAVNGALHAGRTAALTAGTGGTYSTFAGAGGDITLGAAINAGGAGDAIRLAGTRFINNAGANALNTPNGRWIVWSDSPVNDTFGGIHSGNTAVWGTAYDANNPTVAQSGNRFVFNTQNLTGTALVKADDQTKTYGDTFTNFTYTSSATASNAASGASYGNAFTDGGGSGGQIAVSGVLLASTGAAATATRTGGNGGGAVYDISVDVSGASAAGYSSFIAQNGFLTINPRAVSVSASGSKVYDGTTALSSATFAVNGLVNGDTLGATGGAGFGDKNVGIAKNLILSNVTLGANANYILGNAGGTGDIAARALSGAVTANNKTYDGTASATIVARSLSGAIAGDDVSYTGGSATFADKNAATGKAVTVSGLGLAGADAGNYTVNTSASTTADILKLGITGTVTANNKTYDGTASATIASRTLSGFIVGDTVSYTGSSATFADKNAATGKTVTASGLGLAGADAGNYTVNTSATTTASIAQKNLTVTGAIAANKVYDGTTIAAVSGAALSGTIAGDSIALSNATTGTFADKNAGNAKTVTTAMTLGGADARNYTLAQPAGLKANITPAALTITANNDTEVKSNVPYSGGNGITTAGLVAGETVSVLAGTLQYGGTSQGATQQGSYSIVPSGLSSGNYAIRYVNGTLTITNPGGNGGGHGGGHGHHGHWHWSWQGHGHSWGWVWNWLARR